MMKFRVLAAALLAFGSIGSAQAAMCLQPSSTSVDLGPPGQATFCNAFWTSGAFSDAYFFSVAAPANSSGYSTTWDWSWTTNIVLTRVALTNLTTGVTVSDMSPGQFGWQLTSGDYRLAVQGTVGGLPYSFPGSVGYETTVTTAAIGRAAVPEPGTLALLGLGLIGLSLGYRRRVR